MYGLIGKLKAHPGQRDSLAGYLLQGIEELRALEGCYLYVITLATDDPDTIWVTEVWRSQADHRASLELETVRAAITAARPLLAEPPDGFEVTPLGGKGLPDPPES
ncbi:MAG: antibiotic biosynthesis monooxygenase [Chloroflexi bacterium]|nr:antibiotic biosynthesis monooxygenase [Chloroflexota bacterium]